MNLTLAYHGRSAIVSGPGNLAITLAPNLRRDRVSFDGLLKQPLRFREAVGALHDVVVSDFRYQPKDRSAHDAYLAEIKAREAEIRKVATANARREIQKSSTLYADLDVKEVERSFRKMRSVYWGARQKYSNYLVRHDPELWRMLVPCDPVITVAPDCLFLECFSADESSYGCLTVDRDAFSGEQGVSLGTTNVDYSWSLYEHFQKLRSYRETRFVVDPSGFEVRTEFAGDYREEKIDLPPSWLKGFMQVQAAMSLPTRRVPISREGLYSVLAFLNRHRAAKSPRAVRFELTPGKPVAIVLEPWEKRIILHANVYEGPRSGVVRVWGRDRLRLLARLLPLLDEAEVYLLGTGLPSFWSIRMGEMRLLLGLSGWTANDWTGSTALDQIAPPAVPSDELLGEIAATFQDNPSRTFAEIRTQTGAAPAYVVAGLNRLALMGQVIHDLHAGVYRWRQIMPLPLAIDAMGPTSPETAAAAELVATGKVRITRDDRRPDGLRILEGQVPERPVTLLLDADGRMLRGKCTCSHHFKGGLRQGPCRHLQALRDVSNRRECPRSLEAWLASFSA
jgi:hypothetical protein